MRRIQANPGVYVSELQDQTGMKAPGTFYHHLQPLLAEQVVFARKCGARTLLFAAGTREQLVLETLRRRLIDTQTAQSVYQAVCEQPGISFHELQGHLGLSRGAAYYHLRRQTRAGLLLATGEGRAPQAKYGRLYPSAQAARELPKPAGPADAQRLALSDAACRRLHELVLREPGIEHALAKTRTRLPARSFHRAVEQLQHAKLLLVRTTRRKKVLFAAPQVSPSTLGQHEAEACPLGPAPSSQNRCREELG